MVLARMWSITLLFALVTVVRAQPEKLHIATWTEGKAKFALPQTAVKSALEGALHDGSSLKAPEIVRSGKFTYLRAEGTSGGRQSVVAIELETDGAQLYLSPKSATLQCLSENCPRCDIRTSPDGRYIGCKCPKQPGVGNCRVLTRPETAEEVLRIMYDRSGKSKPQEGSQR